MFVFASQQESFPTAIRHLETTCIKLKKVVWRFLSGPMPFVKHIQKIAPKSTAIHDMVDLVLC